MTGKRKSPSKQRATLKWLEKQRQRNRSVNNQAARVHDEIWRQREHNAWKERTRKEND